MGKTDGYRRQAHCNAVVASAPALPVVRHVLEVLCRCSAFDRPEVALSVGQICAASSLSKRAVQRSLAALKAAGVLEVVAAPRGAEAARYRLCVPSGAGAVAGACASRSYKASLQAACRSAGVNGAALWLDRCAVRAVNSGDRASALVIEGPSVAVAALERDYGDQLAALGSRPVRFEADRNSVTDSHRGGD